MLTKNILAHYRLKEMVLSISDKDMTALFYISTPAGSQWLVELEYHIIRAPEKAIIGELFYSEYEYCYGYILIIWRATDLAIIQLCLSATQGEHPDSVYMSYAKEDLPMVEHRFLIDSFFDSRLIHTTKVKLALYATSKFQIDVWFAMLAIPPACVVSYADIATIIHSSKACQAVGSAVGANPIALFIPCHRVIRSDNSLGQYMYGSHLKGQLLTMELGLLSLH